MAYKFLPNCEIVYSESLTEFYTFREFRKRIELWITEEQDHQAKLRQDITRYKSDFGKETDIMWCELCIESSEKREEEARKLSVRSKRCKEGIEANVEKARQFPITDLVHFNTAGFAKCLFHNDRSPSMKFYPNTNTVHCFSGCGSHDAIDIYQKLNDCDFNTALKFLSR